MTRTFQLGAQAKLRSITLRVGRPSRSVDGDYRCVYELRAGRKAREAVIYGVDPIQALLLALRVAGVEVETAARRLGGALSEEQIDDLRRLRRSA